MKLERPALIVCESGHSLLPVTGRTGQRLRALMGGISDQEMRRMFDCENIFDGEMRRWSPDRANVRATAIGICCAADLIVMLGQRVGEAFFYSKKPPFTVLPIPGLNRQILGMVLPNPSTAFKDDAKQAQMIFLLRLALRVADGEPIRDIFCETHGTARVEAPEIDPYRRLYECGCEVLT